MSDTTWLRFLGGSRARIPRTLHSPRSEPTLRLLHQAGRGIEEPQVQQHGAVARLSSWHNMTSTTYESTETNTALENRDLARRGDVIWHNPSLEQMLEALQVKMMTTPLTEPLPVQYHSHILHLIEGYGHLKQRALVAERELAEARNERDKEQEEFGLAREKWMVQQASYKAEIKRLEILIHQTSDMGLEAVTLARSHSLVRPQDCRSTCPPKLEVVNETSQDGTEGTSSRDGALGNHSSILSRPRIVDASSDVRLSKRLVRHAKAKSLQRRRTRERKELAAKQESPSRDTSTAESDSSRTASQSPALLENTRGNQDSRSGDVCRSPSDLTERKQICATLSRSRHRREFSFVPGDDMPKVQNIATAQTGLPDREDGTHATSRRECMDPRLKHTLVKLNSAKDGPVDGGKATAERYQSRN